MFLFLFLVYQGQLVIGKKPIELTESMIHQKKNLK